MKYKIKLITPGIIVELPHQKILNQMIVYYMEKEQLKVYQK